MKGVMSYQAYLRIYILCYGIGKSSSSQTESFFNWLRDAFPNENILVKKVTTTI